MPEQTFLEKGKLAKVPSTKGFDYSFLSSQDFFSPATNLIPQLSGVSGGRVLLGDKAQVQAISLVHREHPLVHSKNELTDESFTKEFSKHMAGVFSDHSGTIKEITPEHITVSSGKEDHKYPLYSNFLMGQKSFLDHTPAVKVGDKVKKNQVLATSNFTDKEGRLALGTNLVTAVMPYRSHNFEDAYVLTEAGAKKLVGEQMIPLTVERERGVTIDKNKFISLFSNKFFNKQLENVDDHGVVKKGTIVNKGDPLVLSFSPRTLRTTDAQLGNISKVLNNAFSDNSHVWDYESPGEVIDVAKTGKQVTVTVKTQRPIVAGDKCSVCFGAKGVVSQVLSNAQTPTLADGTPVDIILNSMSVVSRIAPSVLTSMALGKVAQKTGKDIATASFTKGSLLDHAKEELKKHGLTDLEDVHDPVTGKTLKVFVGPMYVNRLHHISEDKLSSRSSGIGYTQNRQPSKVIKSESSKRVGNLSTNALLAHNATAVLEDIAVRKGTQNDEMWRNLKLGLELPTPEVPFVFKKFISHLEGAGIKVQQDGSRFNFLPLTDKHIEEMTKGEIENPNTFKIKSGELIPEKGGLFDIDRTGINGDYVNHISLSNPIVNPIVEDYIAKTLNITKAKFDDLLGKNELIPALKKIDIDLEIAKLSKEVKSSRKTDRDKKVKVLAFLKNLKSNKLTLNDMILTKIPVIPAVYRPLALQGDRIISSGVNELYRDFMLVNKPLDGVPDDVAANIRRKQYDGVKAIYGLGDPISTKNLQKNYKGLLSTALGVHGGAAKESMFQANVVNKPVDLVGRAVVTSDANLDLNEVGLPHDMVWKMYSPFVIRRLVQAGVPATHAKEYVDTRHPLAAEHLAIEIKDRPVTVSRDPQLHKYSQQGFMVKMNSDPKDTTLKLNPLLAKGFNFDHDGDQMNAYVPVSEEAKEEIKNKMLPSKNLISPRNYNTVYTPSNEAALGLFLASSTQGHGESKHYSNYEEILKDYNSGKLKLSDNIDLKE